MKIRYDEDEDRDNIQIRYGNDKIRKKTVYRLEVRDREIL
jgi:hypothetical protein